jgi:hypothetical protein
LEKYIVKKGIVLCNFGNPWDMNAMLSCMFSDTLRIQRCIYNQEEIKKSPVEDVVHVQED